MPSMYLLSKKGTTVIRSEPCFQGNAIREYRLNNNVELDHCKRIASELFDRFEDMKPNEAAVALDVLIKVRKH